MLGTSALLSENKGSKSTNLSGFVNVSGLDTNFTPLGIDDARAVGTNETRLRLVLERVGHLKWEFSQRHASRSSTHLP